MRAAVIALAILLLASSAWAGPAARRMMAVMGAGSAVYETFAINGYSSIDDDAVEDTGTESIATGTGYITVDASCGAASGSTLATVTLEVDGATDVLTCSGAGGDISSSKTLRRPVSAGPHNVRVYGTVSSVFAAFFATNFRKPQP